MNLKTWYSTPTESEILRLIATGPSPVQTNSSFFYLGNRLQDGCQIRGRLVSDQQSGKHTIVAFNGFFYNETATGRSDLSKESDVGADVTVCTVVQQWALWQ